MTRPLVLCFIAAGIAAASPLSAQLCQGGAALARTHWQLSADATFSSDAKSFDGGLTAGGAGLFGQIAFGKTSFDQFDESSSDWGIGAGWQVALEHGAQLCPIVSLLSSSGPKNVTVAARVVDLSQTNYVFGIAVGGEMGHSRTKFVPFGSISVVARRTKINDQLSGKETSDSETQGLTEIGLGVHFSQNIGLRSSAAVAFGLGGSTLAYGGGVILSF